MKSVRGKKTAKLDRSQLDDRAQIAALVKAQPISDFSMDGTILDVNENFEQLLGYGRAELIGKDVNVFVDEQTRRNPQYQA